MKNQEVEIALESDNRLVFSAILHEEEPETGEYKYSMGDPPIQTHYEITAVSFCGTDITDFVTNYADDLFPKWEEELNRSNNGLDS